MEDDVKGIQDYIQILKRQKIQIIVISSIIFIISVFIAIRLPAIYKSTATILIEQQEIPTELVSSTVTSYADQRIQMISKRVMSRENLENIVDKFNLYAETRKASSSASILDAMKDNISLDMVSANVIDPRSGRPTQATIAFNLSFTSKSAKNAQQVANELVSLYLNENLKQRTQAATDTTAFLSKEAAKLNKKISLIEQELATFKQNNAASLPELQQLNLRLMDRTGQQVMEAERKINSLNTRKLYLQTELSQQSPSLTNFSSIGKRIYGSEDRLTELQAEYVALKAKYANTHPDIVKIQRQILALEKEVGRTDKGGISAQLKAKKSTLVSLSQHYSSNHPDIKKIKQQISDLEFILVQPNKKVYQAIVKPDNPAFIQLQTQLNAVSADLDSMAYSKQQLLAKLQGYEEGLLQAPQVDREYRKMVRDYDNAKLKYREVKTKQMEAEMSQAMEKNRKGERFTLVEPPIFPESPFKPNRKAIVSLGFILAIAAALGYALLRAGMDTGIYGVQKLMNITGAPPLIVIPYIENNEDILKREVLKQRLIILTIGLSIIAIILFHLVIMPLDILWYAWLQKLGLNNVD